MALEIKEAKSRHTSFSENFHSPVSKRRDIFWVDPATAFNTRRASVASELAEFAPMSAILVMDPGCENRLTQAFFDRLVRAFTKSCIVAFGFINKL